MLSFTNLLFNKIFVFNRETELNAASLALEDLRNLTVNQNSMESTLKQTLNLRKNLKYASYKEMLEAEKYLKDPFAVSFIPFPLNFIFSDSPFCNLPFLLFIMLTLLSVPD